MQNSALGCGCLSLRGTSCFSQLILWWSLAVSFGVESRETPQVGGPCFVDLTSQLGTSHRPVPMLMLHPPTDGDLKYRQHF